MELLSLPEAAVERRLQAADRQEAQLAALDQLVAAVRPEVDALVFYNASKNAVQPRRQLELLPAAAVALDLPVALAHQVAQDLPAVVGNSAQ